MRLYSKNSTSTIVATQYSNCFFWGSSNTCIVQPSCKSAFWSCAAMDYAMCILAEFASAVWVQLQGCILAYTHSPSEPGQDVDICACAQSECICGTECISRTKCICEQMHALQWDWMMLHWSRTGAHLLEPVHCGSKTHSCRTHVTCLQLQMYVCTYWTLFASSKSDSSKC